MSLSDIASSLSAIKPLKLIRAWRDCAGPVLAEQTRFQGLKKSAIGPCLAIEVPDPAWRQELRFHMQDILGRFIGALRTQGFPEHEIPVAISLGSEAPVPFKAVNAQKGRDKICVK